MGLLTVQCIYENHLPVDNPLCFTFGVDGEPTDNSSLTYRAKKKQLVNGTAHVY